MAEGGQTGSSELPDLPLGDSLDSLESNVDNMNVDNSFSPNRSRVKVYPEWAKGPFVVFFRQIDKPINVLLVSDILHRTYSSIKEVKRINLRKLRAVFANRDHANDVVTNTSLTALYRVYVPCDEVEISGVIYDDLLEEQVVVERGVGHFKNRNVPPVNVLDCERLSVKINNGGRDEYLPSEAVRVTFAGTALPEYLNIDNVLFKVRLFMPKLMHCDKCQAFGHTTKYCANKPKCGKCGDPHLTDSCQMSEEKCAKCQDKHNSLKDCPVFRQQKDVVRKKLANKSRSSYAEMVKATAPPIDTSNKYDVLANYSEELGEISEDEEGHCSYLVPNKRKRTFRGSQPNPVENSSASSSSTKSDKKPSKEKFPPLPQTQEIPGFRNNRHDNQTQDVPGFRKNAHDRQSQDIPGFRKNTADIQTQDVPGSQMGSDDPPGNNHDNLHKSLRQFVGFVCNILNIESRWVELLNQLIPFVSPLIEKLCESLPLLGTLLNFNA